LFLSEWSVSYLVRSPKNVLKIEILLLRLYFDWNSIVNLLDRQ